MKIKRHINQDELHSLYYLIGRAVWSIQYFEDVIVYYITMKLKIEKPISVDEAYKILEKEQKKTMGKLLNSAKKGDLLPAKFQERFFNFLGERNWLIHKCLKLNGDDLYSDEKRENFFQRIDKIYKESKCLKTILFENLSDWLVSEGLDMKIVNEMAAENLRKLRGC